MSAKITWDQFCERLKNFQPELIGPVENFNIRKSSVKLVCPYNNCGKEIITTKGRDYWLRRIESCGCWRRSQMKALSLSKRTFADVRKILAEMNLELLNGGADDELVFDIKIPGKYKFRCTKICGREFGENTTLDSILSKNTRSCGHLQIEKIRQLGQSHAGYFTLAQRKAADLLSSVTFEILSNQLDRFGSKVKTLFEGVISNRAMVNCICKCGREFTAQAYAIKRGFTFSCGCLKSMLEIELYEFVTSISTDVVRNSRNVIKYYDGKMRELDIYIPDLKLAIELDGLWWHSEDISRKNNKPILMSYHKYLLCKEKGIRLITIFEDEWRDEKDRIKDLLRSVISFQEALLPVDEKGELITQNRVTSNQLYIDAGYKILEEILPAFYLTKNGRRFEEVLFRLPNETEWDCIRRLNLDRVWDCGKTKWGLDRPLGI